MEWKYIISAAKEPGGEEEGGKGEGGRESTVVVDFGKRASSITASELRVDSVEHNITTGRAQHLDEPRFRGR